MRYYLSYFFTSAEISRLDSLRDSTDALSEIGNAEILFMYLADSSVDR